METDQTEDKTQKTKKKETAKTKNRNGKKSNDNITEYFPKFQLDETTNARLALSKLYEFIEERTKSSINWYWEAKKRPASISQFLRKAAIFFGVLGGLCPLLVNYDWIFKDYSPTAGYVLLAIAAGLVLFDKTFGFSSTWIRFVTAAQNLQKILSSLRMDWTDLCLQCDNNNANNKLSSDSITKAFQMLKDYLLKVESVIEAETMKWVDEFKSSLSELERTISTKQEEAKLAIQQEEAKLSKKLDDSKPGAVDVNVANCNFSQKNDLKISLDDLYSINLVGAQYSFIGINPGIHKISVTGIADGRNVAASQSTNILPGQISKVSLTL